MLEMWQIEECVEYDRSKSIKKMHGLWYAGQNLGTALQRLPGKT